MILWKNKQASNFLLQKMKQFTQQDKHMSEWDFISPCQIELTLSDAIEYKYERKGNFNLQFTIERTEVFVYDEFHNFTTVNCISLLVY